MLSATTLRHTMIAIDTADNDILIRSVVKGLAIVIYESLPMIDEMLEGRHSVHGKPPSVWSRPQTSRSSLDWWHIDVHIFARNEEPVANARIVECLARQVN